jgi:hypothetical protein
MYALVGKSALVETHSTVPLTQFLRHTVFSRNQNARYAGTRCTKCFIGILITHGEVICYLSCNCSAILKISENKKLLLFEKSGVSFI